jgi:hypothetical protein
LALLTGRLLLEFLKPAGKLAGFCGFLCCLLLEQAQYGCFHGVYLLLGKETLTKSRQESLCSLLIH